MAGAGFKTFNTGDVLTASDVNTYLMQQTVMVFADASARSTALGANVAEGMISYLKDTNAVEVYNGSAWVSSDDPNAIQNTIVDAKGDIITATAADTPARLAVGANGYTLVADSSTSTGLAYSPTFFAGKNKIINGDFGIWQRGTSSSAQGYQTADRFTAVWDGTGTKTISRQTFTPGTAPVAGYEAQYFLRFDQTVAGTGASYNAFLQPIEDVRTFAGQTITLSFWAKASATTLLPKIELGQNFGSGGSASVDTTIQSNLSITTSWTRYAITYTVPSVSGKTIGTSSSLRVAFYMPINATFTVDLWGVQLEAGSTATQFQTATGTIQGELAACQRYYFRATNANGSRFGTGYNLLTTNMNTFITFPVTMRIAPTALEQTGTATDYLVAHQNTAAACSAVPAFSSASPNGSTVSFTTAAVLTAGQGSAAAANAANAYLGWSAEL